MVSFIAEGNVVVLDSPELRDVEELFWDSDIKPDYEGVLHSVSKPFREERTLQFKDVKDRDAIAFARLVGDFAYEEIILIDWLNITRKVRIMQDTITGNSFSVKLEVVK
jgi:hypothetical protein